MAYAGSKNVIDEDVHDGTDGTETPSGEHTIEAFHDGTEQGKKQFLATFTADEDKAIMRKVDMRFLWLIGITYLIKNSTKMIHTHQQRKKTKRWTTSNEH